METLYLKNVVLENHIELRLPRFHVLFRVVFQKLLSALIDFIGLSKFAFFIHTNELLHIIKHSICLIIAIHSGV